MENEVKKSVELNPRIKVEKQIIDGVEMEVQVIPRGLKTTAVKEEKKVRKNTTKANPTRDSLLKEVIELIEAKGTTIYKAKTGYAFKIGEQWLKMNISASRDEPTDLKAREE